MANDTSFGGHRFSLLATSTGITMSGASVSNPLFTRADVSTLFSLCLSLILTPSHEYIPVLLFQYI